jgi:DNA-binding GntR family transcriptional regulator
MRANQAIERPEASSVTYAKIGADAIGSGQPKAVWAYDVIRDAIITSKLAPGETLNEKETCAALGISRTPMREAVLRLAQEGLLNVVPSGGTFVNDILVRKVIEGHLVRSSLESRTIRLAARYFEPAHGKHLDLLMFRQEQAARIRDTGDAFTVDDEFHQCLCRIAGFPNIWQTIHAATGQLDRVRRRAFPKAGYFSEVVNEHQLIYDALKSNDEEAAASALKVHLQGIVPALEFVLSDDPAIVTRAEDLTLIRNIADL